MAERRFFVVGTQRSGTVYIQSLISSHPDAHCWGEILLGMDGPSRSGYPAALGTRPKMRHIWQAVRSGSATHPKRVMERAWGEAPAGVRAIGFRVMYNQLRPAVLKYLASNDALAIHIVRSNSLRQYVSLVQMRVRQATLGVGSAHSGTGQRFAPVRVRPRSALAYVSERSRERAKVAESFENQIAATIDYEVDILSGEVAALSRKLTASLGLEPRMLAGGTSRTGQSNLADAVLNFDELADYFSDTEYAWMLGN